jgi:hypothetical protein
VPQHYLHKDCKRRWAGPVSNEAAHGGLMEGTWRAHGGLMEGTWRAHGGHMEGSWRAHGGLMEGSRRAHGGLMEGTWRAHGGHQVCWAGDGTWEDWSDRDWLMPSSSSSASAINCFARTASLFTCSATLGTLDLQ